MELLRTLLANNFRLILLNLFDHIAMLQTVVQLTHL